jgi:hypothetical protein
MLSKERAKDLTFSFWIDYLTPFAASGFYTQAEMPLAIKINCQLRCYSIISLIIHHYGNDIGFLMCFVFFFFRIVSLLVISV